MKTKKSNCCNAKIYIAPAYYSTNMKNIPNVKVCVKCGRETT